MIDIKQLFTKGSFQDRIEFFDNKSTFTKGESDFLRDIIINTDIKTNEWYFISLIDLARKMQVENEFLLKRYLGYLIEPNRYYLKLTILDYITDTYKLYDNKNINFNPIRQILDNRNDRLITKNQALLNLILLYPDENEFFREKLKNNLHKTMDYRSHIRIYNNILETDIKKYLPSGYINELMNISESMNLGKGVLDIMIRLKQAIN